MAIRTGIRLGQFFEGLGTDAVDLGHALHVLMEHPNAVESYMEGKNLFVESVSSSETETLEFAQIASTNGPAYIPPLEESAPSGNLVASETSHLNHQTKEYIQTGDFATYLRSIAGSSVGRRMARITVPRVARSEEEIDRTRQEFLAAIKEFKEAGFSPQESFNALSTHQTMHLPYQGRNDLEILQRHGEFIVDEISRKALPQFAYPREGQRKPGRLRLGYLSGHLNKSNNGRWALQWLKNHSKEIETYCFMVGPDVDQTTERFREHSDHYFWLNRSVPQNARFIRSLDLDVVIFTDIGFYARMTQYASLRLAPVQCTAWGGPETSGMANVDYYLSSEFMEPDNAQEFYTEKLVKLPRTGLLFERENIQIPELGRAHFGLPEDGNLMFMGQSCMKLVPFYDQFFASLTHRAGTELVLLESDPPGASRIVKERLQKLGVRTRWLPPVSSLEYLALMKLADVSIDPHCWSGGNTTVQALTLGTPVVTLPGPFMRSRHSKAFLEQANAKGLIARDEEDFLDLACDFERQRAAIAELDANSLYGDLQVVEALDNFLFSVAGV
jgi:predicted O-linked N-acetylglucosamine transferase (SPINDLY family)